MRRPSFLAPLLVLAAAAFAALAAPAGCGGEIPIPGCDARNPCAAGQWCVFPDGQCGKGAASGSCNAISDLPCAASPVCGCDGKVHPTACDAAGAGVDTTDAVNCPAPAGEVACGGTYCTAATQACREGRAATPTGCQATVACAPIPAECSAQPTCACLVSSALGGAGAMCAGDPAAGFTVNDPGGC